MKHHDIFANYRHSYRHISNSFHFTPSPLGFSDFLPEPKYYRLRNH